MRLLIIEGGFCKLLVSYYTRHGGCQKDTVAISFKSDGNGLPCTTQIAHACADQETTIEAATLSTTMDKKCRTVQHAATEIPISAEHPFFNCVGSLGCLSFGAVWLDR